MNRHIVAAAGLLTGVLAAAPLSAQDGAIDRGRYLLHAGGCISCHTAEDDDAVPLAGGHALETPFGTFYTPNITPDPETGIGGWSDEDFLNAFWDGVGPDGEHYFPAFPYTSYTGVSRADLLSIKAYLFTLEPVRRPNRAHDLPWYLSSRLAAGVWKWMNFRPARFEPDADQSDDWNRGAYLVRHLGHCGECHTPRNSMGATIPGREMAGTSGQPETSKAPNITPDREDGIGRWSEFDIIFFLEIGMLPGGDFAGGKMAPVIDDNTGQLSEDDRRAIAVYLQSLPPLKSDTS